MKKILFGLIISSIAATLILQIFNNHWWALFITCIVYLIILFAVICNAKINFWNFLIFQWLFIRLCYFTDDWNNIITCGFIFPVYPLTGWTLLGRKIRFHPKNGWKIVLYKVKYQTNPMNKRMDNII